jgi:hypothetical protein
MEYRKRGSATLQLLELLGFSDDVDEVDKV